MSQGEPSALDLSLREPLEFEFTLTFRLDDSDAFVDDVLRRLDAAECPDSMVGAQATGFIEFQFACTALSAEDALARAERSVIRAFPGAQLMRVLPAEDTPTVDTRPSSNAT